MKAAPAAMARGLIVSLSDIWFDLHSVFLGGAGTPVYGRLPRPCGIANHYDIGDIKKFLVF
jgi:hypothetical protein